MTWTLPGENTVSGTASGLDEVIERARKIAGYGLAVTFERTLLSRDNLALSLHNPANRNGRTLDQYLATVCRLRGDRIAEIETCLSDVDGMDAFLA
ncbi:MAG TPA: nuclear transport factor 2 family protein [Pseudonocardiaceae bacterium]|nr:nuclear transport factor 2 family protein [Pseudonocardiaceae bacterium]